MIILGREPQDTNEKILRKPRSGDRNIAVIPAAHGTTDVCRPLRGLRVYLSSLAWGSRPQAKNMPRLRRSNQGVTPEDLHGGSTSGANLFQDPAFSILHQVCGWTKKSAAEAALVRNR